MSLPSAWRSSWLVWVLPLACVLANAGIYALHPGRTGRGFATMEQSLAEETRALGELDAKLAAFAELRDVAAVNRSGVTELYEDRFSTQAQRMTTLLSEVKALAARAGFNVSRFSYSDQQLKAFGLASKEITFHVQGSYAQFRNLLNLLEVSEYFIVLKRVSLGGADGANLSIDLRLATFFSEPDVSGPIRAAVATR